MYQDVIQKTLSSNLEAFLIESTPFGFNPTKLTKSCPNGNEERRTKISFIFLKRQSKIYFKDNYTDTAELSHIVISVWWLNVSIFTHSKEEMLFYKPEKLRW